MGRPEAAAAALLLPLVACATPSEPDPLERSNRAVFAFNEGVDRYVLEPVATGWDVVVPEWVQDRLSDFFDHLDMPRVLLNDLLQLKGEAAAYDVVRVITNTVFGFGGFYDVASREGVPENDEDFGQTLGYWGTPAGAYLVVPFLGPSTVRDLPASAVDAYSGVPYGWFVPLVTTVVTGVVSTTVEVVNLRARYLEEVRQDRREAFDYYVFIRSAYLQNRSKKVSDATDLEEQESEEDLYYFDDESGGADELDQGR
jgi:phospholipid-binding lipoprotein MlaA